MLLEKAEFGLRGCLPDDVFEILQGWFFLRLSADVVCIKTTEAFKDNEMQGLFIDVRVRP